MPRIRDGSNRVTEYDMGPPPTNGAGPVERRQVSAERMADFAAERARMSEHDRRQHLSLAEKAERARATEAASRARGARAAGFVQGATKPHLVKQAKEKPVASPPKLSSARNPGAKAQNGLLIVEALRSTASYAEAATKLGIGSHGLQQRVSRLRKAGLLPADVDKMIRARGTDHLALARQAKVERRHERLIPIVDEPEQRTESSPQPSPATIALLEAAGLREPDPGIVPVHSFGNIFPADSAPELPVTPTLEEIAAELRPTVVLPCAGCLHAVVCMIKPSAEELAAAIEANGIVVRDDWAARTRSNGGPDPALSFASLTIGCDYRLEATS